MLCASYHNAIFNPGLHIRPLLQLKEMAGGAVEMAVACNRAGISSDPRIGEHAGLIGVLSRNRTTRADYTLQAVEMALVFTENTAWYPSDKGGKAE